jgi:hypothetical protein
MEVTEEHEQLAHSLISRLLASAPARASNQAQWMFFHVETIITPHSVEFAVSRDKRPCTTTTTITSHCLIDGKLIGHVVLLAHNAAFHLVYMSMWSLL